MGEEISTLHFSPQDYTAFTKRVRAELELLHCWEAEGLFVDGPMTTGLELEAWLLQDGTKPSPDNGQFLESLANDSVVPELAKFNFELNVEPQAVAGDGLPRMQAELGRAWQKCGERASELNRRITCIGVLPTVTQSMLCLQNMTPRSRFAALNRQVVKQRRGAPLCLDIDGIDELHVTHPDVMLESAATSLQVHLKVPLRDAARMMNAFSIASSATVALAANAPLVFGKRLWHDSRITIFEQAVDTSDGLRRVSFGDAYAPNDFLSLFESKVREFPIVLPVEVDEPVERVPHLRLHNGTLWSWNRPLIGFEENGQPHVRIEHRVMSAGPTMVDMLANVALSLGLAYALADYREPGNGTLKQLPPDDQCLFDQARQNFYSAARSGLDAQVTWMGKRSTLKELLLERWLPMTREGLGALEVDSEFMDTSMEILWERTRSGRTGAVWQLEAFDRHRGNMAAIVDDYLTCQAMGRAVHLW